MSGRIGKKCSVNGCKNYTFHLYEGICDDCINKEIKNTFTEEE